jgi:hypothetical protein
MKSTILFALVAAGLLSATVPGYCATQNAEERRDARDVKQDTRKEARDTKVDCRQANQKNNG